MAQNKGLRGRCGEGEEEGSRLVHNDVGGDGGEQAIISGDGRNGAVKKHQPGGFEENEDGAERKDGGGSLGEVQSRRGQRTRDVVSCKSGVE